MSSRERSGNSRSQLSSLVMIVASMPKDGPTSKRPTTFTSRSLISVTIGPSAAKRSPTGPNSGREAESNSTTSCPASSGRPAAKPGVSRMSSSGSMPIALMLRRSLFHGFFQVAGKM